MTYTKKVLQMEELLENLKDDLQYDLFKKYCEHMQYDTEECFKLFELDDIISIEGMHLSEIIIKYGDIDLDDIYFYINGYDYIETFNKMDDYVNWKEVAECIIDNEINFDNAEVKDFLEKWQ